MSRPTFEEIRARADAAVDFNVRLARAWSRDALRYPWSVERYHAMRDGCMEAAREMRFVVSGQRTLTETRREDRRIAKLYAWAEARDAAKGKDQTPP